MTTANQRQRITGVAGRRYGEVLLVDIGDSGPRATVYNTFPLNDCPAQLWCDLDAAALATDNGAALALLNGPRYWLMNTIEKVPRTAPATKTFGGIDMVEQATVELSSMNPAPYTVNEVDRRAVFIFDAGEQIYELIDPEGRPWVMQAWSQIVDAGLARADLAGLAGRLNLPAGWDYRSRVLSEPLQVDTTSRPARVVQDDLANTYSLHST